VKSAPIENKVNIMLDRSNLNEVLDLLYIGTPTPHSNHQIKKIFSNVNGVFPEAYQGESLRYI
jgi:hypothetical protein